jgi:hypothetical protein
MIVKDDGIYIPLGQGKSKAESPWIRETKWIYTPKWTNVDYSGPLRELYFNC